MAKLSKDANYALMPVLFVTSPMGLSPLSYNSVFSQLRFVYAVVSQLWMMSSQIAAAGLGCGDAAAAAIEYVMMAACAAMALAKLVAFRAHMPHLERVFSSALDDWLRIDEQESLLLMRSSAKTARKAFFFQIVFSYVSNALLVVGALPFLVPPPSNETLGLNLSMPSRQLPMLTGCMFAEYPNAVYASLYLYESVMIWVTAHGNVGSDVVIFCLAMHVSGQLELLKGRIASMTVAQARDSQLKSFIEKHIESLDLVRRLDRTVSEFLVVQLLLNAGINLMLGIRILIALKSEMPISVLQPIVAFVVMMFQLYLLSYASERMAEKAGSMVDAIYDSCWYELAPNLRKDLTFVGMRANRPIYLTAGHFYAMNMENFVGMLKASFSYFSILRVVFDG